MNHPPASAQATVNTDLHHATSTRLRGPWLVLLRLAWVVLSVLALIIFMASLPVYFASQQKSYTVGYAVFLLALGIFVALVWFIVALLIFWRKAHDWMALLVSFMLVLQGVGTTIYPLDAIPSIWLLPAVILDMLSFILLFLVFSLFPTGRFVPRWIGWLAVLFAAVWLGALMVGFFHLFPGIFSQLFPLAVYGFLGGFVVAQLYRYHAVSSRTERQQTKWIVFGVTVAVLIEFVYTLSSDLFPSFFSTGSLADLILSPILVTGLPILIPLSFGFAILRYRLWEIDAIINRTLVYSTLTVLLAFIYLGLVIALQSLVRVLTGVVAQQPLIIVASTLMIAALFQPLRRRIQATIDRRFYRRKYDAAKTLEAFSATLRNELELNQLSEQLLAVVQQTMQPAHISLWLRHPEPLREQNTRLLPRIEEEERHSP
jgi:hypothetical protein